MGLKLTVNCAFPDPLPRHPLFRRVTLLCGHPPLSSGIWRPNIASMPHEHEPQYTPLTTLSRPESSPVLPTFHHSLRLLRRLQNPFYPQLLADVTKKLRDALPKGNSSSSSPPVPEFPLTRPHCGRVGSAVEQRMRVQQPVLGIAGYQ